MGDREFVNEEMPTARLSLRRPTIADVDVIYAIHRDQRACAHNPSEMLTTRTGAEDLYRRWDAHWKHYGFGYWIMHPHDAGEPLGICGIKVMRFRDREVLNLFYRLDPSKWGNGLATEAGTAVVRWATTHVPDHPLIARIRPGNTASIRVATRIGLRRAEHLDCAGEDGPDWIFALNWYGSPAPGR